MAHFTQKKKMRSSYLTLNRQSWVLKSPAHHCLWDNAVCELPEKSTTPFSSAQLGNLEKTQVISNATGIPNSIKAVDTVRWASPLSYVRQNTDINTAISIHVWILPLFQAYSSWMLSIFSMHLLSWLAESSENTNTFPHSILTLIISIFFFTSRIHKVPWEASCHRAS